ncbi:Disks large-associated protein 4 [Dissostichus eleginoides]|uniref:Disks large-associated protein 4 n=1 Tax=Dissostichus eleginoides TaxID=100907 RepID=A0AAD9CGI0_DISEL|nr:Disks large-associated protein 4 [Dissostichus eleginoides]
MKGLGTNRNRHLSESCEPPSGHPEALYSHKTCTIPRSPYLLSPTMDHYGTMDPHLYPSANQGSLPPECMLPLNNQLSNSSTFPGFTTTPTTSLTSPHLETASGGLAQGPWAPPCHWDRVWAWA